MKIKTSPQKQQGAATLLTALILLICITLIGLLTSKTVLVETQMAADNYRTSQASAAANAAMDRAVAYFNAGGLDQRNNATGAATADGLVDYTGPGTEPTTTNCAMPAATATTTFPLTLTSGAQTTFAHFYFDNTAGNACDCTTNDCMSATNMARALVTAKGWSDDCTAVRTITQCIGTFDIFNGGKGPQQPFIGRASVGAFGNATIINRYTNSSIWTGGSATATGAAFATYLRPSNTEIGDYTTAQLDAGCSTNACNTNAADNIQPVSNRNAGNGIDVIDNDPTLTTQTASTIDLTTPAANTFFGMFFAQTKAQIRQAASTANQLLAAGSNLNGLTGLIWVNGNETINATDTIGSATNPVILIIDGNLTLNGGATIFGVVYITGTVAITGNPVVTGSIVAESQTPSSGGGTLTLIYKPWGNNYGGTPLPLPPGTGAIIAGSWKDW
ncbi:hypothetical protein [Candidatus Methylobacter oryzae]|uniref:Type 4 fimbrial biogenesis protein PilX N-terminal domain-containing protein n=1 Tax=Candidatus Methylobacter oryzae TaxID=2497749 RepID=A0ABY3CGI8_9GAMM|nr:hypothetical protein [Candidatus Methylobacter oryzae]TRX02943.1 hypothetical protein EKO24_001265 [Candidatus Methylobacter oryzae]